MAFKLVNIKQVSRGVRRGEASLSSNGLLTFNKIDLVDLRFVANANDKAAVLVDVDTRRVAIRVALDGEPAAKLRYNKGNSAACVNVTKALAELGIKTIKAKRYTATIKDNLIFIVL